MDAYAVGAVQSGCSSTLALLASLVIRLFSMLVCLWCQRPQGAMRQLMFLGGFLGVGRANKVHSHFHAYVMLRYWTFSWTSTHSKAVAHTHTQRLQTRLAQTLEVQYLYAAVAQSPHRQGSQQIWRTLCLNWRNKEKLLQEGPGTRTKSFIVVKHSILQFWGDPSTKKNTNLMKRNEHLQITSNYQYHSFGHLNNHHVIGWCHHRHSLLQSWQLIHIESYWYILIPCLPFDTTAGFLTFFL